MPFWARFLKGSTVAVGCLAILIHACNESVAAPPVTITATGYEVFEPVISIAWIDNTQLLFAGSKSASMDATRTSYEPQRLYIWNQNNKSVRVYADATSFCYTNGRISYLLRRDKTVGKVFKRVGPIGAEKEIELPLPSTRTSFHKFRCGFHLREELVPTAIGRRIVVLREGDGYIDLGPDLPQERLAQPKNVTLYPAKGNPLQLPITSDEDIGGYGTSYSTYLGAYVMPPRFALGKWQLGEWPPGEPRVVYLVWPDGRVERVSIPPTPYLHHPRPNKLGWIYGGGRARTAGAYFYDGKMSSIIETGAVREIDTSPDGCKAAVAIQNRFMDKGGTPVNVKVFNFCTGGR